jgi:hypothetical protein
MVILSAIGEALRSAFDMFWDVLWPLVLGFGLSSLAHLLLWGSWAIS